MQLQQLRKNVADYERATELEHIGGEILALPGTGKTPIALPAGNVTPFRKELVWHHEK